VLYNAYFSVYVDGIGVALMGSQIHQARIAVSVLHPDSTRNMYIANNRIDASRPTPTCGIKWHSRRGVITDNLLTASTARISSGTSGSDTPEYWAFPYNQNLGVVLIERNVMKPTGVVPDSGTWGVLINNKNMVARNNLIYDIPIAFGGGDTSTNTHIYNNTVYLPAGRSGGNVGWGDFVGTSSANQWYVRNNVVLSENPGSAWNGEIGVFGSVSGLSISNNVYHKPVKTNWFCIHDTDVYTFAQWQAMGLDSGSQNADPLFASTDTADPSFLHLQPGSPAIGAGTAVPVFEDFNRNPRPLSGPQDAGAFVSGSSAATRAGDPGHTRAATFRVSSRPGGFTVRVPEGNAGPVRLAIYDAVGRLVCRGGVDGSSGAAGPQLRRHMAGGVCVARVSVRTWSASTTCPIVR
jgi:hypothetical protein